PKLSDRAVVLFHDINVRENDFGVWRYWEELSRRYPAFTFLHSHGLGVLGVGAQRPRALEPLFAADEHDAQRIRKAFAAFGETWTRKSAPAPEVAAARLAAEAAQAAAARLTAGQE